ncbi:hypothetical protein ES703_114617 [subsurface metagenome]
MAKVTTFPAKDIISGFKGKLDFYVHDGIPCVRLWPRSPGHKRAPAVEAQWTAFTQAAQYWHLVSKEVQDAYNKMASGTGLTGRDLYTRGFIRGLYRYETAEEKIVNLIWKDTPVEILNLVDQDTPIDWTTLDLAPFVSAKAVAVILWLEVDCGDWGDSGDSRFKLRKKGTAADRPWWVFKNDRQNWLTMDAVLTLGMNTNKQIEYKLEFAPGASDFYVRLFLLGYFETA